jgi:acyl transferase domain-containing protein/acyl carrier protein/NAD(P)-dependent dehydrogenase (short-subunit alcohol dehydrogenase family)
MPDAPNATAFWENIKNGRYSITEVPPDRWDPALYYDPDHSVPDKTYSKIGGWVREFPWEPMKWKLAIPPRVADAMDDGQKWALACTREALMDYGYPNRPMDLDRTGVILGNAMGGEKHYFTSLRVYFPEYARELAESETFAGLPEAMQRDITRELHKRIDKKLPPVTEDSMPGELANCTAGRVANVFNLHGPNYTCDAACASAMAAINSAVEGLIEHDYDLVFSGGIDRNMGASSFVKFCKIGALSATGSRPYAEGADGFIMGEGAAIFLLKRLADAERDGDKIYAVLRGMGASSDGKGKGITAPNPIGQRFAVERAWKNAGIPLSSVTMIEGHGTSTAVGDVVEAQSIVDLLADSKLPQGSIALGSVKSNLGHLKGGAGAAGFFKATMALHHKMLPPSLNFKRPNPNIDFAHSPLYVNTELRPWEIKSDNVRRAGLSAFGFGGTNFHAVFEEYIPHRLTNGNGKKSVSVNIPSTAPMRDTAAPTRNASLPTRDVSLPNRDASLPNRDATLPSRDRKGAGKTPLRGALVLGANSPQALAERLRSVHKAALAGQAPPPAPPVESDLRAQERIAIDYANAAELADKAGKALKAWEASQSAAWKPLRAQGIFRGNGPAPKVAFLYTGQGSQYVNMLRPIRAVEPIVAEMFAEADRIMTPLLGKPLTEFIYVDAADKNAVAKAEDDLRQTAITQPAVLATDLAMTRLLAAYGIEPDMTMGHSLGEYGALVASGALPFDDALLAVSARGREMTRVSMADNGHMAAVFAPMEKIESIIKTIDGYVVVANINSNNQAVIGGASVAVDKAVEAFLNAGFNAVPLPVSHAFHTSIVAPASEPLRRQLEKLRLAPPRIPIVANVDGQFYPMAPDAVPQMLDILGRQVAAPVQFIKGLETLYAAGVRVFVETGPKKALQGFAEEVLGPRGDVVSLFTNHPKVEDITAFNQALCGLYAAGLGAGIPAEKPATEPLLPTRETPLPTRDALPSRDREGAGSPLTGDRYADLGRLFAGVLERGWEILGNRETRGSAPPSLDPVAVTGASVGLPGTERIFDDSNVARILRGEQLIDVIPTRFRRAILDKHITRLVKTDNGGPVFETINSASEVIKLAGRGGAFDLEKEFGIPAERVAALDRTTALAIAVGIDALRDAGIPLVMRYKTTTKGTQLPDRWGLPDNMRDDTGIIFASVFTGMDSFADDLRRYYSDQGRREQLATLETLRERVNGNPTLRSEIDQRIQDLKATIEREAYTFDRRFIFRVLAMGHSQFAELIGARGPNTHVDAACASTTHAVSVAEDWIRSGRCRRVIIVSSDDITSDHMMEWFGSAFLATGAAATDEVVEEAALPFDRRRHGMITGMGAAAIVVESAGAARERGVRPICQVLSAITANSAFHGTRLDVKHIATLMEKLVAEAERRGGVPRQQLAEKMVFVSHETYTPARGGSASAEIHALRTVFGSAADKIVIANTKGFTGHAMGAGIEDVVAVKALETGCVPPVANFKEVDPELGPLNLSKGGTYPVEYAMRLGAGFGSQIALTLYRWVPTKDRVRPSPANLGYASRIADRPAWDTWLTRMAGKPSAALEVVNRTLRVRDGVGVPALPETFEEVPVKQPEPAVIVPPPPLPSRDREGARTDPVKERILALVAEKTGYPADMLALDLDLEADLGVDTVKQAEVFAGVREAYNIPREENLRLRDFPTLAHVIQFVRDRRPDLAASAPVPPPPPTPSKPASDPVLERILALVVEKTGYPAEMLDPDLDLEADLGVDTVKQAELFAAVREAYNIPREENLRLRDFPTLAHVVKFVRDRRPDLTVQPVIEPIPSRDREGAGTDPVMERILALVVEKTGYPAEMLDPDLDLEADLGVDTVKQAELFAAVREAYNIPREENLRLRDFPTLAHVVKFVHDRRPDLAATAPVSAAASTPPSLPAETGAVDPVKERLIALVVEKTGYPAEMLSMDLDLEADLGIDTVKQAELFAAIRQQYDIPRDADLKLRDFPTLAHVVKFVYDHRPDLAAKPAAPPAPQAPVADEIQEKVLDIVAEKTGYPKDMLDLDLDLEADLGVDTVKQAEMFASVRAAFNIPRDADLKLRDFPTLAHVIRFARERSGLAKPQEAAAEPEPARPAAAPLDATNVIPRRAPVPVLRPALSLCKATGVDLSPGKRVLLMPDTGGVADALAARLAEMGVEVLRDATAPIDGVFWLPALDIEPNIAAMDLTAWRDALQVRVKSLYATMRTLYDQVAKPGTFLVSATRLGGQHGYDPAGAAAPLGGAVTGFTKTYKWERPDALVKAVDFAPDAASADVAEALVGETLRDNGAVEIGYRDGQRWTVGLRELPAEDGNPGLALGKETVFVVTGAAGSIVSAITTDLAAASGGVFYLMDVVPEPDPNNPDIKKFATARDELKRDLFERISAKGKRATPAAIEKELAGLERAHAAASAIEAVRAAGGTAQYLQVNLTDEKAVAKAVDVIRQQSGRIDVLLHAAGVERSHFLPDKDPKEFDLVFDVKADGWFNLLRAIGDMPLGATVAFSSVAGRFGNAGQADYSSANDLLCKISSSFRTTRPQTRGIAVDWSAWGGIGMATRGSIPKMMEMAGIEMIPPEAGIPFIRRELTAGGTRGEVLAALRLGILGHEWDPTGGLDIDAIRPATPQPAMPMLGSVASIGIHHGLTIETTLDPAVQPFLYDHQIDGTPVLPGVMGIEAFAEAAKCLLPEWHIDAVEDVTFLAPFKFYRAQPRSLTVEAFLQPEGDKIAAECQLIGSRQLPGQAEPQVTTHFKARVLLARQAPEARTSAPPPAGNSVVEAATIYQAYFHGPAYQVVRRAWQENGRTVGEFAPDLPPNHVPADQPLAIAPRLIELCFQTAGLREMRLRDKMGLPLHADRVLYFKDPAQAEGPLFAVVTEAEGEAFDVEVIDQQGNVFLQLKAYSTVALEGGIKAEPLHALHAAM